MSGILSELDMLTESCKVSLQNDVQTRDLTPGKAGTRLSAKTIDPVVGLTNNPMPLHYQTHRASRLPPKPRLMDKAISPCCTSAIVKKRLVPAEAALMQTKPRRNQNAKQPIRISNVDSCNNSMKQPRRYATCQLS